MLLASLRSRSTASSRNVSRRALSLDSRHRRLARGGQAARRAAPMLAEFPHHLPSSRCCHAGRRRARRPPTWAGAEAQAATSRPWTRRARRRALARCLEGRGTPSAPFRHLGHHGAPLRHLWCTHRAPLACLRAARLAARWRRLLRRVSLRRSWWGWRRRSSSISSISSISSRSRTSTWRRGASRCGERRWTATMRRARRR